MNRRMGVVTVAAGSIIGICLGSAYSWGIFLFPIDMEMSWGRAKISAAVSVLLLVFSCFMVVAGLCEKRFGPRITSTAGAVLFCGGWILSSYAQSPLWLYVTYGLLGGIGTGLCYMASISAAIKWFPDKKGMVTGIVVFGFGFGTAVYSPLGSHLIELYGWRLTMVIYGILFGPISIIASQFLKIPAISTVSLAQKNTDFAATRSSSSTFSPKEMLRTSSFKIMFVTYFMAMVAGMMTIGHINAYTRDRGFTSLHAAFALTLLSIGNGAGRIASGALSDRIAKPRLLAILFGIIACAIFLLPHANCLIYIYILAVIIGLCFGGFLAVYPPATADFFGARDFSINYGLVFLGYGMGCFLGAWLGGAIYDIVGNYTMAFRIAGGTALFGSIIVFFALKPPRS